MLLFLEGFDKYGGINANGTVVQSLLSAGEWTSVAGTTNTIVAPLSSTGQALLFAAGGSCTKTLASAIGRTIGGVRVSSTLGSGTGVQFLDGASNQCGIGINTNGTISMRNGSNVSGTVLGTSTTSITANSTHYLEWDITLGNSAAWNVYLDGVSIISGTGDTTATANNTISGVQFGGSSGLTIDDVYLFDASGSRNNAVLLTSPRIETTFPSSDSSIQFGIGASILGASVGRSATAFSTAANQFYVRPFTPSRNMTLNSIVVYPNATNATVNLRPIVYADSAGVPGALMSAGSTVTGTTASTALTMPLTTPQSLTAGTQYWLGFMADVLVANLFVLADATAAGRTATSTFGSGAPGTAPATTAGQATVLLWGGVTLASAANYYEVNIQPPPAANTSYVFDSNVGDEDLYNFPSLSAMPATIYGVAAKAYCARSDSGARTVSIRMKSGSTDSGGTSTGQTPGTTFGWNTSLFETDPNGSIAWTGVALNAAQTGFKIDS